MAGHPRLEIMLILGLSILIQNCLCVSSTSVVYTYTGDEGGTISFIGCAHQQQGVVMKRVVNNKGTEETICTSTISMPNGTDTRTSGFQCIQHDKYSIRVTKSNAIMEDSGVYYCKTMTDQLIWSTYTLILGTPTLTLPDLIAAEAIIEVVCQVPFMMHPSIGEAHDLFPSNIVMHVGLLSEIHGGTYKHTPGILGEKESIYERSLVYEPSESDNGEKFHCSASNKIHPHIITNTDEVMNVLYGVHDLEFDPDFNEGNDPLCLNVGDEITCSAMGNPEPSYTWTRITSVGPGTIKGPRFTIDPSLNKTDYNKYMCRASNEVGKNVFRVEGLVQFHVALATRAVATWKLAIIMMVISLLVFHSF